jgi:hypothetical protein
MPEVIKQGEIHCSLEVIIGISQSVHQYRTTVLASHFVHHLRSGPTVLVFRSYTHSKSSSLYLLLYMSLKLRNTKPGLPRAAEHIP